MVERVPCRFCGAMILPATFAENDGLCATCVRIPEEFRNAQQDYDRRLDSGEVFTPTAVESEAAHGSESLGLRLITWLLEPNYYADRPSESPQMVFASLGELTAGEMYLVDGSQKRLSFTFNGVYAVCEYSDQRGMYYAYAPENLRQQVDHRHHLAQGCPCCGVGLGWYPSRCHMPKKLGFQLVNTMLAGDDLPPVQWVESDDFSYVSQGKG